MHHNDTLKNYEQRMNEWPSKRKKDKYASHHHITLSHKDCNYFLCVQIDDFKHEATSLQQQRKQDEILIESLKFENQLMRAQLRGCNR